MKNSLTLMLLLVCTFTYAQHRYQFTTYNIFPQKDSMSNPVSLTEFKGKVYFYAHDTNGRELWCLDGNNLSSFDIEPGPESGGVDRPGICNMMVGNDTLYFVGRSNGTGTELYKYDGKNFPQLAYDINPGQPSSGAILHAFHDNKLYFSAIDGSGPQAWLYSLDVKTYALKQLTGLPGSPFNGVGGYAIIYKEKLYTECYVDGYEMALCAYDIKKDEMELIADIDKVGNRLFINNFSIINGDLYFQASTQQEGTNLYRYDGSNPPENFTESLIPGPASTVSFGHSLTYAYYNNGIYFIGGAGTSTTTCHLHSYNPVTKTLTNHVTMNQLLQGNNFIVYNDRLFYNADEHFMYESGSTHTHLSALNPAIITNWAFESAVINNRLYYSGATNKTGVDLELFVLYDTTLNVTTITKSSISINLYPNPTTQDAYLDVKLKEAQTMQVLVTDIRGRIVYNSKAQLYSTGSHTINLPVQQLPPGAYVYRIADKNGMLLQSGKLLKE